MATKNSEVEKRHAELRAARRKLEAELAVIDTEIREAINNGDLASLERLSSRKKELPQLFIAASTAETTARHEMFNAEDDVNMRVLEKAEALRDKLTLSFEKRKVEIEAELSAMKIKIDEAEGQVSEAYNAIAGSRNLGASGDEGFKKSLEALGDW